MYSVGNILKPWYSNVENIVEAIAYNHNDLTIA